MIGKKSISIIICFYNAEKKIVKTLEAIKKLNIKGISNVELLLINNNSNDSTKELIHSTLKDFSSFSWKILDEPNPGLTNARFCGVKNSKNDILLFCDDDNWLNSDYLIKGLEILEKDNNIGILGGKGVAISSIEIPNWFIDVQNYYAVGPQMPTSGQVIGIRNVVYGAGMFVNKEYLINILNKGFVPVSSDRKGKSLSSGGDSELCLVFQIAGYKIWYDEKLQFKHFIESNRLTIEYISALKKGISTSSFLTKFYRSYFQGYRPSISKMFWMKEIFYLLKSSLLELIKGNINNSRALIKNSFFIVNLRNDYDAKIKNIIAICDNISTLKTNK